MIRLKDRPFTGTRWPSGSSCRRALAQALRGRETASGASLLLLTLFIGLQIADIVTTDYLLAIPGISEANPLMALSQAELGAAWWLPKLAVAGCLCLAAFSAQRRRPMIFAVFVSGLIVLGNLAQL